jgi:hypothetical protein
MKGQFVKVAFLIRKIESLIIAETYFLERDVIINVASLVNYLQNVYYLDPKVVNILLSELIRGLVFNEF